MNKFLLESIELIEYLPRSLPANALPPELGEMLWREYDEKGGKIRVEFPSPRTNHQWRLTAQGWVGAIPLAGNFNLALKPKVSLGNLFRMWEYAYALKSFHFLAGLIGATSLLEFYERLAHVLTQRILERARQGFHRAYLPHTSSLSYVRGRLEARSTWQNPVHVALTCHYEEHTADIPDNQILAYTLGQIARSGRCRQRVQAAVRRGYHALQGIATPRPYLPQECSGRSYNRLNQDYQPLHALCRFFLEHSGPGHERGERAMIPFLVNMARLYELFVAEWLKAHLPAPWRANVQETVRLGPGDELQFDIDLVLYDDHEQARVVLDTKYKAPDGVDNPDFNQIVTYAKAKDCRAAVLVYPTPLVRPLDVRIGDLHVRSLVFALEGDLEEAGRQFLAELLAG